MKFGWTNTFGSFGSGAGVKKPASPEDIIWWAKNGVLTGTTNDVNDIAQEPQLSAAKYVGNAVVHQDGTNGQDTGIVFDPGSQDFYVLASRSLDSDPAQVSYMWDGRDGNDDGVRVLWNGPANELWGSIGSLDLKWLAGANIFPTGELQVVAFERVGSTVNLYHDDLTTPVATFTGTIPPTSNIVNPILIGSDENNGTLSVGDFHELYAEIDGTAIVHLKASGADKIYDISGNGLHADFTAGNTNGTNDTAKSSNIEFGFTEYSDVSPVSLVKYYDNRVCAALHTIDDYNKNDAAVFLGAIDVASANDMVTSVATYATDELLSPASITNLQAYIDSGEATICSHSLDTFNFQSITDDDLPFLEETVRDSKVWLEDNFTLQNASRYNGANKLVGWIQSYGTANAPYQDVIDGHVQTYNYLMDYGLTSGTEQNYTEWGDDFPRLFNRCFRFTFQGETTNNTIFNDTYNIGGVYVLFTHPWDLDYSAGQPVNNHLIHVGGRADVWYCGADELYMYRYLCSKATPSITVDEQAGYHEIRVEADSAEREKYALSYPLTYKVDVPNGTTTVTVEYKEDGGSYSAVTEKTAVEIFNGIDAFRTDLANDCVYVSHSLPQTKNVMYLKVSYS